MPQKKRFKLSLFDTTGMTDGVKRSLYLLIVGIAFGQICMTITNGPAIAGYLRALGAGDFVYSLIVSIPVFMCVMQPIGAFVMERTRKRKGLFIASLLVQRILWLPFGLVPFFIPLPYEVVRIWMVALFYSLLSASGSFGNTMFFSMVADLVPMRIRGRYFSTRARVATVMGVLIGLVSGALLDQLPGFGGYAVVFAIASIFGIVDIACFFWVEDPPMQQREVQGFFSIIKEVFKNRPFMKLVLFFTAWNFAVNLSAPFFSVYMIEQLEMTYTEIILTSQTVANVLSVITVTFWGRLMDEHGNRPVIKIAAFICAFSPFLWTFSGPRIFFIVPIIQAITGAVWIAIDLGSQNMYLAESPDKNRSMYVAVYFVMTQVVGIALASMVGGFLLENVWVWFESLRLNVAGFAMTRYNYQFLLSGTVRLFVAILLVRLIGQGEGSTVREMLAAILKQMGYTINTIKRRLALSAAARKLRRGQE